MVALAQNTADYSASSSAVTVYLDGTAGSNGDAAGDTPRQCREGIEGSAHNDTLYGSTGAGYA